MSKIANTKHDVLEVVKQRWSPRAFSPKAISAETLERLLEAAVWSASSYNEQPWRFIVVTKADTEAYNKMFETLNPWNQIWAKTAPVLIMVVAKTHFSHNQERNAHHFYDCGAAINTMSLQAVKEGVFMHQMAGIFPEKVVESFNIPTDEYEVVVALALGYLGEAEQLPEAFHVGEKQERSRKALSEVVFGETWGEKSSLLS